MGRTASGVRGIRLKKDDVVVGMDAVVQDKKVQSAFELLTVMKNGYGKRTSLTQYKRQGRGGSGIRTAHVTQKTGRIVSALVINAKDVTDMLVVSDRGQIIRLPVKSVSVLGRDTQGVRVMRFREDGDGVSSVTMI